MSTDLLSELKSVERSTEYDSEKAEIFNDWVDIRKTTEMTQQYVGAVQIAMNKRHSLEKEALISEN